MKTPRKYPITKKALNPQRLQKVNHPWNRGFPNNRRLKELTEALKQ